MRALCFSLLLFLTSFARASSFYVSETTVVGMNPADAVTVTELIKADVPAQGEHQIVFHAHEAQFVLRPKLIKLGTAYILSIEKLRNSKVVFSSQMKAQSFEDVDTVIARVVRATLNEVAIHMDARVKDVTESETHENVRRRGTVNRWYLGFGPAALTQTGLNGSQFNWAIGYFWEVNPRTAVKVFYDGTASNFNYMGLGGNYYFYDTDSTPVAMAELGYGEVTRLEPEQPKEQTKGFMLGVGGGYQLFRTSKVNVELLLHAAVQTEAGLPSKAGFRVGLYW